ncbi:MAG: hypothetical protein DDG60_03825 [Anaerolineae bacterium]|nr:MAG: hypothetical protein DDG60_03825 [Anaerolineae bacterium]
MQTLKKMLPGLLISLTLIAVILYFVDLHAVADAFRKANYGLLAVVFVMGVAWLMVRGVVWRTLLRERASYKDTFLTLTEGYLLNNFLPFRLGELGRAFLLSRKSELRFVEILPTIVIERVTDLVFSAAIFAASVPFVVGAGGAERFALVIGGVMLAGLAAMYALARNRDGALDVFHRASHRWPLVQRLGGRFLESFLAGLGVLNDPWLSARFFGWMTLNWGMAIVQYYLLALAYYPQAQLVWGMFSLGAAAFGGAIPSLPGAVGTLEGAYGGALTLLSGDQSTALAIALTWRVFNYTQSGLFGLYALSREGQTIGGIYRELLRLANRETENG